MSYAVGIDLGTSRTAGAVSYADIRARGSVAHRNGGTDYEALRRLFQ